MVIRIMEERKEGEWLGHVEQCDMRRVQVYSNEQSAQLSGTYMYMYTKLQTQ